MKNIILQNISLKPFNYLKVGGAAEYFSEPKNLEELKWAFKWAHQNQMPLTILGGGSNVLISDKGIKGLTLRTQSLNQCKLTQLDAGLRIVAQVGTSKFELAKIFLKSKLAPALFLSGLPGDVGGGIFMNAGVREDRAPREFHELVEWIEVLRWCDEKQEGVIHKLSHNDIDWSYRSSLGWQPGIIINASLIWLESPQNDILEKVKAANKLRISKQPLNYPNCGSVFKNPNPTISAGSIIESCGLKSFKIGGAEISEKHANFIINKELKAKAKDIYDIIEHVKQTVKQKKSIDLHTEVRLLGQW